MISDLNKALRKLREYGPLRHDSGICYNVALLMMGERRSSTAIYAVIENLAAEWPEFSGDREYPVPPHSCGVHMLINTPASAYLNCSDMFSTEHEYGRARLRLLDYLIEVTDGQ